MKKLLTLILSLAIVAASLLCAFSANAEVAEGDYVYTPADSVGYENGKLDIRAGSALTGEALAKASPRITNNGIDGSNAMEIGGTDAYTRYLIIYRLKDGILSANTSYTIEMKIKRTAGKINTFNSGIFVSGSYVYSDTVLSDSQLSDEFQTFTFEHSISSRPCRLLINFTAASGGATLVIDDIKIYETADAEKTNLFTGENFYDNTTGTDAPGTFDKGKELWFDSDVDEELVYTPFESIGYRTNAAQTFGVVPELSSAGEGVKGSYAMKLTTAASTKAQLAFQAGSTSAYAPSTEYIIEIKIKKSSGAISGNLEIGMLNDVGISKSIAANELTNEYIYYKWSHTTNTATGWRYFIIKYTAGAEGVTLLIDDIKIYPKNSPDALVQFHGQSPKMDADCDFDSKVEYKLTDKCGEYSLVNNIILVDEADTAVSAFKTACSAPSIVTVKLLDGEAVMEDTAIVKTDAVLSATVEGNEATYTIAVKYDVNSNGSFDIADIVKAARISEGVTPSAAQLVAANATEDTVTDANILALRLALLAK